MPLDATLPVVSTEPASPAPVGRFEQLPKWPNLTPMVLQWLWLGIVHRSISLPSAANPGITSGGLVGDGKMEYFNSMGPVAAAATATHIGVLNEPDVGVANVMGRMASSGLCFPVVAKPDLGWCGYGVRLLGGSDDLARCWDRVIAASLSPAHGSPACSPNSW